MIIYFHQSQRKLVMHYGEVKTVFLNGDLHEEIYMK
jgi:hypothetical protein